MANSISCKCPACDSNMIITSMMCSHCGTILEGEFEIGRFSRLDKEQIAFLEAFIRCRGSFKLLEREAGQSYPTLKARLDDIISAMGMESAKPIPKDELERRTRVRMDILDKLESGEITAQQARDLIKG